MELTKHDFFYCYSKYVSEFLTAEWIKYIHIGVEPKSSKLYSMYFINDKLQEALAKYTTNNHYKLEIINYTIGGM